MTQTKKAAGQMAASQNTRPNDTKISKILGILKSGISLNRFDAEHYGDHCLNSTIATLKADGNLFNDEWEEVPTRFGVTARVKRYWYIGRSA